MNLANSPDFEQAREYAVRRLEQELSPGLYYHGLIHTRDDIVPAAESLAGGEGIQDDELLLLLTAAWFHDIGFVEVRAGHEAVGARIASEVLPGFGYDASQVETIQAIIMATVIPQSPVTLLEEIMADADLDVLGRDDFMLRNNNLRRELAFFGQEFTDAQWLSAQLKFVESHVYFTKTARARGDAGQARNTADLRRRLEEIK
ncbi:MAG: phosphohydrolase [Bacteroidota bacterium]